MNTQRWADTGTKTQRHKYIQLRQARDQREVCMYVRVEQWEMEWRSEQRCRKKQSSRKVGAEKGQAAS